MDELKRTSKGLHPPKSTHSLGSMRLKASQNGGKVLSSTAPSSLGTSPLAEFLSQFDSSNMSSSLNDSNFDPTTSFVNSGQPIDLDDVEALRSEVTRLQFALSLERRRGRPMKLVSGSQFRLPLGPTMRCEHCLTTDKNLKSSREYVRSLKLQLARLEEQLSSMRKEKTGETVQFTEFDELLSTQASLQKKYEECETDLLQLRKISHADKVQLEDVTKQFAELQATSQTQLLEARDELEKLRSSVATLSAEKGDLLEIVEKLKSGLGMYKQQLEQSEMKRREVRKKSLVLKAGENNYIEEMVRLKNELTAKEEENMEVTAKMTQASTELATVSGLVSELQEVQKGLKVSRDEAQRKVRQLNKDVEAANKKMATLEAELKVSKKERDKELADKDKEISRLQAEIEALNEEPRRLNEKLSELTFQMNEDRSNVWRELDNIAANSVRLCVVAPTVNVQVADRQLKLQAGFPQNALKEFIVNEVLSQFTFLFKQIGDNIGPDGSDIQSWVQNMLLSMQESIEQYVKSAMEERN